MSDHCKQHQHHNTTNTRSLGLSVDNLESKKSERIREVSSIEIVIHLEVKSKLTEYQKQK